MARHARELERGASTGDDRLEQRARSEPDAAGVLLDLQRTAGNAAVAAMLAGRSGAPKRTVMAGVDALAASAPGAMHLKTVDYQAPQAFPEKLGESVNPALGTLALPQVTTPPAEDHGVRIEATDARDSDDFQSISAPPGATFEKAGLPLHVFREMIQIPDAAGFPIKGTAQLDPPREGQTLVNDPGWTIRYVIDEPTAQLIRDNEQEHPNDFAQAFEVSARVVAAAVDSLKGKRFDNETEALQELLSRLPAKLRPRWPTFPEGWRQHLWEVLWALYDLSKARDRAPRYEHNPKERRARLEPDVKRVTIWPVLNRPGAKPSISEITLERADIAQETPVLETPAAPWAKQQGLLLEEPFGSDVFDHDLKHDRGRRELPRNTFGTFTGQVVRKRQLWLRIDLEGPDRPVLLIQPGEAARFRPGAPIGPPTEAPPPPPPAAAAPALVKGGKVRLAADNTPIRLFDNIPAAMWPEGENDVENGAARGFQEVFAIEDVFENDGTALISKETGWEDTPRFYAVVPITLLGPPS